MSEQQKKGRLGEVIRFVVTGGVCFLIEQAVLSLLKEIFGLDVNIGTPIAFLVSARTAAAARRKRALCSQAASVSS